MMEQNKIMASTKAIGKYEEVIIRRIVAHFSARGYEAFPHARFNIAWGSILSDLDVLLVKNDTVTVVEVKSRRDRISRGVQQILAISDYIDFGYIASDHKPRVWKDSPIGLLLVSDTSIDCISEANRFTGRPLLKSLLSLKKEHLLRRVGTERRNDVLKYELAVQVHQTASESSLRRDLKRIAVWGD